jgi:GNAT superfamily N-acetyltransferase
MKPYIFNEANAREREIAIGKIEDLAYTVDIGISDPDNEKIISLLVDEQDNPIGGIWRAPEIRNNTYDFNIAVMPKYQGEGVSRLLLDSMMEDFSTLKEQQPELKMSVYVINPHLRDMLYRRGLYVHKDLRDRPGENSVVMSPCEDFSVFLKNAINTDPTAYNQAIAFAANQQGMDTDDWIAFTSDWSGGMQHKSEVNFPVLGMQTFIHALPLNELDKRFLWEQTNVAAGERYDFPDDLIEVLPEPEGPYTGQPIHNPDRPELSSLVRRT